MPCVVWGEDWDIGLQITNSNECYFLNIKSVRAEQNNRLGLFMLLHQGSGFSTINPLSVWRLRTGSNNRNSLTFLLLFPLKSKLKYKIKAREIAQWAE